MRKYNPLTEYQRYQIYALKKEGHTQKNIAANIGVARRFLESCAATEVNEAIAPTRPIRKRWLVIAIRPRRPR